MRKRRILVLGGYGMIGAVTMRHLAGSGHAVVGLGRSSETARRVLPEAEWVIRDLRDMQDPADWAPVLNGIDVVVNCSGALQDTPQDDVTLVQEHAIRALIPAAEAAGCSVVQVSAAGVSSETKTAFFASKARADAALQQSGLTWTILRPGLVIGPTGYGGTQLLRMLAAIPIVQPLALANAEVQTVSLSDVARAIGEVIEGRVPAGQTYDLVEERTHLLGDLVCEVRAWLGFRPAHAVWVLPDALTRLVASVADGLGRLGWRSPLRRTAIQVLRDGVTGDAKLWNSVGFPISSLRESLKEAPARVEDRLAARMTLLMPLVVFCLSCFWIVSGLVGVLRLNDAARVLTDVGWSEALASVSVLFWSLVDTALGCAILIRKYAKPATLAMFCVCLIYLTSATFVTPHLWVDPLGPLVKIVPAAVLAVLARVMLETR